MFARESHLIVVFCSIRFFGPHLGSDLMLFCAAAQCAFPRHVRQGRPKIKKQRNLLVGQETLPRPFSVLEKCMDGHELCLESQRSPSFETRDATEWSANAEFLFDRLVFDIFRNRVVPCVVWCSKELVDCCVGSVPQIC